MNFELDDTSKSMINNIFFIVKIYLILILLSLISISYFLYNISNK